MVARYEATATRLYDAPRALVWAIVADTNRSDRALGLAPAQYRWERGDDGRMVRIARARELGIDVEWIEPPYEWIEGRRIEGRRIFVKAPVATGAFSAYLEDAPGGKTKLTVTVSCGIEGLPRFVIGPVQRGKFKRALARYLDGLERVLSGWRAHPLSAQEPAAVQVRRILATSTEEVAVGPRTPPDRGLLAERAARLRESGIAPRIVDKLVAHLAGRPDEEVSQMRPFELARLWGEDRREVLRAFLYATTFGLTDLRWQINGPVCRVGASVVDSLASVEGTSHCAACQIHYDTDFAQHVEAVFPCNEAVRPVAPALYCASSPAFLPHVYAQLRAAPGEPCVHELDLPPGPLHVRVLGRRGGLDLDPIEGPARLVLRVGADAIDAEVRPARDGASTIEIVCAGSEPAVVLLERAGWAADAVLGTVISRFPEFLDLFATEAPARGVDLRVGHVALLFSDLVGSTALYQRAGDARAFALVEEHFRRAGRIIAKEGGAIVKTMGDAIMASFPTLCEAVRAARAMVEAQAVAESEHGLGVKIGVHAGPCLAVRANDRLDFFGTTVNVAARLQAKAASGELVLTRESAEDPRVAPLLAGLPARRFSAALKGIAAEQDLVAFDCRVAATEAEREHAAAEE